MGVFESILGGFGRWIDSGVRTLRDRFHRRSGGPRGRTLAERRGDLARSISHRVDSARRSWERAPDSERRKYRVFAVLIAAAMLGITSGVAAFYFLGGHNTITGEDAAAIKALRDRMAEEQTTSPSSLFPGAK